ncbi:MAG: pseudouridine synthase [Candidatus Krumholzibacteriota bacterium]
MARKPADKPSSAPPAERWKPSRAMGLARALMKAGYGTRIQTSEMVVEGRITVDDEVIFDPNSMIDVGSLVCLDGEPLARLRPSYYAFNKPVRVVCSVSDGPERRLVAEFFPRNVPGLQTTGRLDGKTTGLLLISNDRRWNNLVTGSRCLEQEFRVQVEGELTEIEIGVMTAGVHLPNLGLFKPLSVKVVEILNNRTVVTMVVREGRIRQVRRMLSTLRHKVVFVRRTRIGEIRLGDLPSGGIRHLTAGEVRSVFETEKKKADPKPGKGGD